MQIVFSLVMVRMFVLGKTLLFLVNKLLLHLTGSDIAEINKAVPQLLLHYDLQLANPKQGWSIVSHTFVVQKNFHVIVRRR